MTNEQILYKLGSIKKGTYVNIKKAKDMGNGVIKISDLLMRVGCNYAKLAINKDKVTGPLPWGHWVEGLENLVIENKGNYYVRVTSKTPDNPDGADVISTMYMLDGAEISKEEALNLAEPKALKSGSSPVYNIKFENILAIGSK